MEPLLLCWDDDKWLLLLFVEEFELEVTIGPLFDTFSTMIFAFFEFVNGDGLRLSEKLLLLLMILWSLESSEFIELESRLLLLLTLKATLLNILLLVLVIVVLKLSYCWFVVFEDGAVVVIVDGWFFFLIPLENFDLLVALVVVDSNEFGVGLAAAAAAAAAAAFWAFFSLFLFLPRKSTLNMFRPYVEKN